MYTQLNFINKTALIQTRNLQYGNSLPGKTHRATQIIVIQTTESDQRSQPVLLSVTPC